MDNKECYVFRDLYNSYLEEELEEETAVFIKEHLEACMECKKWTLNYTQGEEQKHYDDNSSLEKESSFENKEDEKTIKRLKIIMIIGIGIVAFLAIWMSVWMYI